MHGDKDVDTTVLFHQVFVFYFVAFCGKQCLSQTDIEVSDMSCSWGSNLSCGKSEEKYGPVFNCRNTLMIMLSVLLV